MESEKETPNTRELALLQAYPELSRVLCGERGPGLQRELLLLLAQAYPERSVRKVVRVIAKMIRRVADLDVEESVLVHDISESGMSVTISNYSNMALTEALAPVFLLRVTAHGAQQLSQREIRVSGRLVRVVASTEIGTVVAFRFEVVSSEDRQGLYDVVQWVNPKERRQNVEG